MPRDKKYRSAKKFDRLKLSRIKEPSRVKARNRYRSIKHIKPKICTKLVLKNHQNAESGLFSRNESTNLFIFIFVNLQRNFLHYEIFGY